MTGPDQGFLLLTSTLGDPDRRPLTVAQFRGLAKRVQEAERDVSARDLEVADLMALGYDQVMAERIFGLFSGTNSLREYLRRGESCDCVPITRLNPLYPGAVRRRLGLDSPGVLWAKGDVTLLGLPAVAVIGSRDLQEQNREFAEEAGRQIAKQGYVLVSGNARGADKCAQEACLEAGGSVISVVADSLESHALRPNVLYLSEDGFDLSFSPQRALSRNRVIHALGTRTLVAQCDLGKGGTWDGTVKNLRRGDSPVFCFCDGSPAMPELADLGARLIPEKALENLDALLPDELNFMDR